MKCWTPADIHSNDLELLSGFVHFQVFRVYSHGQRFKTTLEMCFCPLNALVTSESEMTCMRLCHLYVGLAISKHLIKPHFAFFKNGNGSPEGTYCLRLPFTMQA